MRKEIGMLFIHGIGHDNHLEASSFERSVDELEAWIVREIPMSANSVSFQKVRWQEELEVHQSQVFLASVQKPARITGAFEDILTWMKLSAPKRWFIRFFRKGIESALPRAFVKGRSLLVSYLGDAAAYEHRAGELDSAYNRIHTKVHDALMRIYKEAGDRAVPVIVVAHSFGSHIVSNYIWDAQVDREVRNGNLKAHAARRGIWRVEPMEEVDEKRRDFLSLGTLYRFFSTGCNIALFVSGLGKIKTFMAPVPGFKWLTYWDLNDVLSWPLKELAFNGHIPEKPYAEIVTEEKVLEMSGIFPHDEYWKQELFLKRLGSELRHLIQEQGEVISVT